MFPENLDSIKEDVSKRQLEEKKNEIKNISQKKASHHLINGLIVTIAVLGVFFLFLWIMNSIRY